MNLVDTYEIKIEQAEKSIDILQRRIIGLRKELERKNTLLLNAKPTLNEIKKVENSIKEAQLRIGRYQARIFKNEFQKSFQNIDLSGIDKQLQTLRVKELRDITNQRFKKIYYNNLVGLDMRNFNRQASENLETMKAIRLGKSLRNEIDNNIRAYRNFGKTATNEDRKASQSVGFLKRKIEGLGNVFNRLKSKWQRGLNVGTFDGVVNGVGKVDKKTKQLNKTVKENQTLLQTWWQRFGEVGLGFTLVYRAMNAVEMGIRTFIGIIGEAIRESGEFVEIHGRLAMMGTIFGSNAKNFNEAFKLSTANMIAFRKATVTAISPVQDLMQGLDEMAQWGYIIPPKMMKAFVNFEDFTEMVAATTGSSARQVRQEFQALAQGIKRPGNILVSLIERLKGGKNLVDAIVGGGIRGQEALYKIINFISDKMGKLKEIMAERSPMMTWQVGFKNLTFTIMDTINAADKLANHLKLRVQKDGNIFAYTISEAFKRMKSAFSTPVFQGAFATDMIMFNKAVLTLVDNFTKLTKVIVVLISYLNNMFPAIKTIISDIWTLVKYTVGIYALKSAFGLLFGILGSVVKPAAKLVGLFTSSIVKIAELITYVKELGFVYTIAAKAGEGWVKVKKAMSKINAVLIGEESILTTQTVAVSAAIVGLVAVALYAYGQFDKIQKNLSVAAKNIRYKTKIEAKNVWEDLKHPFTPSKTFGKIIPDKYKTEPLEGPFTGIWTGAKKLFNGVIDIFTDKENELEERAKTLFGVFMKNTSEQTKGLFPEMTSKLSKGAAKAVDDAGSNLKSAFDEALRRGNWSLARKLIPYLKAENKKAIEDLEKMRHNLTAEYRKTKDKNYLLAMMGIYGKEKILEAIDYNKQLNDAIKKFDDKRVKEIQKRIGKERKESEKEEKLLKNHKELVQEINEKIVNLTGTPYEKFETQLNKEIEGYKKKFKKLGIPKVDWEGILNILKYAEITNWLKKRTQGTTTFMQDMWKSAAITMRDTFSNYFVEAMRGKFHKLSDYVVGFLSAVRDAMAQLLGQKIGTTIINAAATAFKLAPIKSANGNILKGGFQAFQSGGIVNKPTLGLIGEGKYNEAVVPLPDGRHIEAIVKNSSPNVELNVINKSQPVNARVSKPQWDGKRWVINVVLEALQTNPDFRSAVRMG